VAVQAVAVDDDRLQLEKHELEEEGGEEEEEKKKRRKQKNGKRMKKEKGEKERRLVHPSPLGVSTVRSLLEKGAHRQSCKVDR
jgi:hypothetical protein